MKTITAWCGSALCLMATAHAHLDAQGAPEGGGAPLVRLKYAQFDPLGGEPAVPAALAGRGGVYLVQFVGPPSQEFRDALGTMGAMVENFLPDHVHVVSMEAGAVEAVAALPFVRWVGPYHPAYRLDAEILRKLGVGNGLATGGDDLKGGSERYSVEVHRRGPAQQLSVAGRVAAMGGIVEMVSPDGFRMEASLTPAQLVAVAHMDEVNFIDPWQGPPGADMDIVRQLGGAVPLLSGVGVTGQGVRAEILETGLDLEHPDFQDPPPLVHGPTGFPSTDHGSAAYGICFGDGTGNAQATGLLPDAEQGIFSYYLQFDQFGGGKTLPEHLAEALDPRGPYRISFISVALGNAYVSIYTTLSAALDDALFNHDVVWVQSMGNAVAPIGRPQGWSKNVVTIGAVNHANTLDKGDDAATVVGGPASDGRIKPDLVHVTDAVFTTAAAGAYAQFGGTSAATSITAGHFGLLAQLWHEGAVPGFGGKPTVFESRAHAATAKALMINAAAQYDWLAGGPNASLTRDRQGWGMADLGALYELKDKTFVIDQSVSLPHQGSAAYVLTVDAGQPVLNATMVYKDPKGNPASAVARVNDLSLKLVSPWGAIYWGNHGLKAGIVSAPGGSPDSVNTVECVRLVDPEPGEWIVEVIAFEVVQDADPGTPQIDAPFALVVSGVELGGACYADCDGSGALNIDDFVCFQLAFALGQAQADCDGNGVLNIDDFICFQLAFALGC